MELLWFPVVSIVVILVVIGGFWFFNRTISRNWNRHKAETVSQWEAEGVEFIRGPSGGQFSGLTSLGADKSIKGIGFVALTDKDLRVTRSVPSEVWITTYKQIKGVAIQPKFLGRQAKKTNFIVVRFVKDGEKDKIGFMVKDVDEWAQDIAQAAKVKLKVQKE